MRRPPRPSSRTQGGTWNDRKFAVEPGDHALGRSRGGLSTKIHALTDQKTRPVVVILTGGQAGDNPQLLPLLTVHRHWHRPGRARGLRILADKAYSHPSTRNALRRKGIPHTIPERSDQKAHRAAKGTTGGRPPDFDPEMYKLRNVVERGFLGLKQWRGIATRYDKHALTYLGGVLLATALTHTKTS